MIIRVVNSIDTKKDFVLPSYSIVLYMALHVLTAALVSSAVDTIQVKDNDIFNKYNRIYQIMIIVVGSCSYPIVLIKFMQQLLGLWIINYTIFLLYLAILIFRCATLPFDLHPEIILDVGNPENYNQANRFHLAVIMLWLFTLEYSIKIDTNLPKRIWSKYIHRPVLSVWLKVRDVPEVVYDSLKEDTESDIVSISSSLPSYRTEDLPSYSEDQVQPSLPPLYEETDDLMASDSHSIVLMPLISRESFEEDLNRADNNETLVQQYRKVFREAEFLFLWFSIEYEELVRVDESA